jgi:Alcohol dehydrogenase GroES-like domain
MKVEACGLCHSDMLTKEGLNSRLGLPQSPRPRVAGTVDELGEGVTNWSKGQRVGVGWIGGHCTICQPCRRGKFAACEKAQIPGIVYDEGYAEHMITSAQGLAAIPDALSLTEAAPLLRETRRPSLYRYQRSPARRSSSKTRWRKNHPGHRPRLQIDDSSGSRPMCRRDLNGYRRESGQHRSLPNANRYDPPRRARLALRHGYGFRRRHAPCRPKRYPPVVGRLNGAATCGSGPPHKLLSLIACFLRG